MELWRRGADCVLRWYLNARVVFIRSCFVLWKGILRFVASATLKSFRVPRDALPGRGALDSATGLLTAAEFNCGAGCVSVGVRGSGIALNILVARNRLCCNSFQVRTKVD